MLCLPSTLRKVRDYETMKMTTTGFDIHNIYKKYRILESITKTKTPLINMNNCLSHRYRSTRGYDDINNKGNNLNNSFKHKDKFNSERKGVFTYKSDNNMLIKKTITRSESDHNMLCSKTRYNVIPFKIKPLDYNLSFTSFHKNNISISNSTNNKHIHLKSIYHHKRKNKSSINTNLQSSSHMKQFYLKKTNQKSSFNLLKTDYTLNNNNNYYYYYNTYIRNNRVINQNITTKDKININNFSNAVHKTNIKGLLKYAYKTQTGQKENKIQKINQDYILIKTNINNILDFNMFAVLDGHGENGHLASSYVGEFIYRKIIECQQPNNKLTNQKDMYNKLKNNNYEIIKNAFISAETDLKTKNINYNDSGTTCCLVIQIGNNIICANTGDSRSILIKSIKNKTSNTYYKHIALSNDHKPINDKERKRIELSGGKVEQSIRNGKICGTYRVWAKNGNYPGLAVSRTIGDLNASCLGVIPEPEVKEYIIDDNCKYIIIASDGLWDVIDNKTVVEITKEYYEEGDPDKLCEELVNEATIIWEQQEGNIDDISVIAAFFESGK
jgi:serine/threonine protein phosphatase PrpC